MASGQAGRLAVDVAGVQECLQAAREAVSAVLVADPGNRADAKSWLTTTVAHLKDVAAATKLTCFSPVSSSSSNSRAQHEDTYFESKQQHRSGISNRSGDGDRRHYRSSKHGISSNSSRNRDRLQYNSSSRRREPNHQQQQQPSPVSSCKAASLQLLQLLTDAQPAAVAQLLSQDSNFLCDYLTSNPSVTSSWFNHFSLSGIQNFKFGSRALANYALTHRSEIWQYLVWTGKHDQAPVAVAAKPHYFSELDVTKTLRNLAKYCPGFWQSAELLRSCEGGEWLRLNSEMITEVLYDLLHNTRSSRHHQLLQLVDSYILSADWSFLCNRLLLLMSEQQVMDFVKLVAQQQQQQRVDEGLTSHQQQQQQQRVDRSQQQDYHHSSSGSGLLQQWLQQQTAYTNKAVAAHTSAAGTAAHPAIAIAAAAAGSELPCVSSLPLLVLAVAQQCSTFDQLLLANALSCHRSQLLTLLQQQDNGDTALQILQLVEVAQQLFNFQQQQQQDPEEGEAAAAAAASGAAVLPVMQYLKQQVLAANKQSAADAPQPLLLLLLVGWLLRLHLLLAAAAADDDAMQLSDVLHQLGCKCQVLSDSSGEQQQQQVVQSLDLHQAHQSDKGTKILQQDLDPPQQQQQQQDLDPPQQQQQDLDPQQQQQDLDPQQQQQQQDLDPPQQQQQDLDPQQQQQQRQHIDLQQQQQDLDPQQQQQQRQHIDPLQQQQGNGPLSNDPQWKPLRRGQAALEQQQQQQQDHKHKLKSKHSSKKLHRHKQHHNKRKRRHTTSSSDPESETEAADSTGSDAENGRRRRSGKHRKHKRSKHSRKHRRLQRPSSSSSSGRSSDSEGGSEMDYDAGGELLDPADYKVQSLQSLRTANDASITSAQESVATAPAAAAAAGCSESRMTAHLNAAQQQQLAEVLGRLTSSSVGGKLLGGPRWVVGLPSSGSKTTSSQTLATTVVAAGAVDSSSVVRASDGDSCYVWVAGTAAEVADVAAWYCVSRWVA